MHKKLSVILTGATGMIGEGVLHECLQHEDVERILILTRRPTGNSDAKVKEVVVADFSDLRAVEGEVKNYNTCFFCSGVSSVGMNEPEYTEKTYTLTLGVARTLNKLNPELIFCYVSGAATDSTEKGKSMWARVKGKTENDLLKLCKNAYMFRPGYMHPTKGLKNVLKYYKYISWMYPFLRLIFPKYVSTMKEMGVAMIKCASQGSDKRVLEVRDIVQLAKN